MEGRDRLLKALTWNWKGGIGIQSLLNGIGRDSEALPLYGVERGEGRECVCAYQRELEGGIGSLCL